MQAWRALVYAMELPENRENQEFSQTAIDVIGNLASVGPDEDDEEEDEGKEEQLQEEMRAVHSKIINQGGVVQLLRQCQALALEIQMRSMSAKRSLHLFVEVAWKYVPLGLLDVLMDVMKQFDWDDGITEKATGLVVVLTNRYWILSSGCNGCPCQCNGYS